VILNKTILIALFGLFLLEVRSAKADDEAFALASFNRSVQSADPRQAQVAFEQSHTNPPTKEEMDQILKTLVDAAVDVMDQAGRFEKNFPQSKQLRDVRFSAAATLATDFGNMGFPIPTNRVADVETCARNLLKENPNNLGMSICLVRLAQVLPTARGIALARELSSESALDSIRKMAEQTLITLERIGRPLEFSFTALDGNKINLADLHGKVVLVDFWATTCVPCVRELPDMKKLYEKEHAKGLEIVGISLDSDKAALTRFVEKEKIPWPQFYDAAGETNRLAIQYGIAAIPVLWLVDKHGLLRQLDARSDQERKVEALLKE
jgi:peroxiredoxin